MRRIYTYLSLLIGITLLFTACEKSELHSELENSEILWSQFKINNKNSYQYTHTTLSWTGWRTSTTIEVNDGKITKREFNGYMISYYNNVPDTTKKIEIIELNEDVNKHPELMKDKTLDEIYQLARSHADNQQLNGRFVFESKNNGLISRSGIFDDDCVDDCFDGINITEIKPLNP
ncbi:MULTISPECIES: hypothetical protein [Sphingobacterium]|uniref:Lipoprotein n=1 Tax=Sphingobacterium tenebrionis TaxID=3111775 RepID=A0ABU8I7E7_9SPHI|nr:hypothetical protein [Sphingobacterium sp. CZ-2]QBR11417.1 hypothetical protein E3D81_04210 [Sphingobacterium sp. CZ-2]